MQGEMVSVVTVCFNAEEVIRKTIESVLSQTYRPIEYILVDGESCDGTCAIIEEYQAEFENSGFVYKYISEKDKGIYDAMNKGVRLASGEWVNFMNAGDFFYSEDVLACLFKSEYANNIQVLYGNTSKCYSCGEFCMKPKNYEKLSERMIFCHQSAFVRRSALLEQPFDLSYPIAADFNFFHSLYQKQVGMYYIPVIVSSYEAENGVSSKNLQVKIEYARIRGIDKSFLWKLWFLQKAGRFHLKTLLNRLFPVCIRETLRKWNYKRLSKR